MRVHQKLLFATSMLAVGFVAACGDDDSDDDSTNGRSGSGGETDAGAGSGARSGGGGRGGATGGTVNEAGEDAGGAPTTAGSKATGGAAGRTPVGEAGAGGGGAGAGGEPSICDPDAAVDGGELTGTIDEDTLLESGHSYTLVGIVKVAEGVTLNIEPCTTIYGDRATTGTLVVLPGGRIEARGTADAPIVFTSALAPGRRAPGDWGGVIILGNAQNNDAERTNLQVEIEGLTDGTVFGRPVATAANDEDSGVLEYVRIEYPGIDLDGAGNEINGLTLGAVGSGTRLSHVMVSNTLDDCFEWFGGAVNADHLIAHNCGDDMFDLDSGFIGSVQFAFGKQIDTATSDPNGFEWDNESTTSTQTPVSDPVFSNVTLCGVQTPRNNPHVGAVLRRGVHGSIVNAIITGFPNGALSVRDVAATPASGTNTSVSNTLVFENDSLFDVATSAAINAAWFTGQEGNSEAAPVDFGNCFGDVPAPFPAEAIEGGTPPAGLDRSATYVGAFADADDNWMTGAWVDWSTE